MQACRKECSPTSKKGLCPALCIVFGRTAVARRWLGRLPTPTPNPSGDSTDEQVKPGLELPQLCGVTPRTQKATFSLTA